MRKLLYALTLLASPFFLNQTLASNPIVLKGKEASSKVTHAVMVRYNNRSPLPQFVRFDPADPLPGSAFTTWIQQFFKNGTQPHLNLLKVRRDKYGFTHRKYQEMVNGYPIEFGIVKAHSRNGYLNSYSGELYPTTVNASSASLSEKEALSHALTFLGASVYKWQLPGAEKTIKFLKKDPNATFYPKGELVYIYKNNKPGDQLRLAYKFDIYSEKPLSRKDVYVDAQTGEILYTNEKIHDANVTGSGTTLYSGSRSYVTDNYSGSSYRLRESNRNGSVDVETYDMSNQTDYSNSQDFTSTSTSWSTDGGLDAHWGAEEVVDFYFNELGRNSIDDNGMTVYSYAHYNNNYDNAFWDGYKMTYGDGQGNNTPYTALDISGHEMTHGVVQYTANFSGSYTEAGALNESFADIFGNTIEHYAKPGDFSWEVGSDLGFVVRDMSNPNSQSKPDTYQGTYWDSSGEPHYNACPHDYYFYLLVEGGSGTNDIGDSYNVTGIGFDDAIAIAYYNLYNELNSNATYADARVGAIQAATDLFGACSQQVISVTNAYYAIGVGAAYSGGAVSSNFTASPTTSCSVPLTVTFSNTGSTGSSNTYSWDFGDGSTSTAENPTHTYTSFGQYDVTLTITPSSSGCGSDTETKTAFIDADPSNSCFTCDTINYPIPGTLTIYGTSQGGYLSGWNGYGDIGKANQFTSFGTNTHVTGALIGFYGVYDSGSGASVDINIYDDNSGVPGNILKTITVSLSDLESSLTYTGGTHQGVLVFTFPEPVAVTSPYYLGVEMNGFTANDSLGIISNKDGDSPSDMMFERWSDGTWHSYSSAWGGNSLDLYISPIMTETPPDAVIAANKTTICAGDSIQFDGYTGSLNVEKGGYYWDVTGADVATSNDSIFYATYSTAGTYNALLYVIGGCSGQDVDTVQIVVTASPTIAVASVDDPSTCGGNGTIHLTFTGVADGTYTIDYDSGSFSNVTVSSGTATITAPAGTYSNLTIESGGCSSVSGVSATVSDPGLLPQPTIATTGATCSSDGTANVSNYDGSYTYSFTPAGPSVGTGGAISGATAGISYTIVAQSGGCSSNSATFTVAEQLPTPSAPTIATTAATCSSDGTATVSDYDGSYAYTFTPSGPSVGTGGSISGATAGTNYTVVAETGGCTSTSSSFTVATQLPTPNAPTVATTAATCSSDGTATVSDYDGSYTYTFSPSGPSVGAGGTISNASASTNYTLVASIGGCSSSSTNFNLDAQLPSPVLTVNSTTPPAICGGTGSFDLSFTGITDGNYTITYNTGSFTNVTVSGGTATVNAPAGTYGDLIISDGTCSSATGVSVSISDPNAPDQPAVQAVAATCSAAGSASVTNYDASNTYAFSPSGPTLSSTGEIQGATAGQNYTVTSSLGSCTSAGESFVIDAQLTQPSVTASALDNALCEGESTTISASGASTYSWDNSLGAGASHSITPSSTTTYQVTGTAANGCAAIATVTVTVQPTVVVQASASQTTICEGNSVTLSASGATDYSWSQGLGSGASQSVAPTTNTTYVVTGTTNGCSGKDSVSIVVNSLPSVQVTATETSICEGGSVVLSATGADSYSWSPSSSLNASTGVSVTATPLTTTSYQVAGTNSCGFDTKTITVTVYPAPTLPTITQSGNTLYVTLNSGETASWYHNGVLVGNGDQTTISESGDYTVVVTNDNGCSAQTTGTFTASLNGLEVNKQSLLKVYPNPTENQVIVDWGSLKEVQSVSVFDLLGNVVKTRSVSSNAHQMTIDLSRYGKGVYIIRLQTKDRIISQKVTKQ